MTYDEFIEKVLDGKSVNARAKELGIAQTTLSNYKLGRNAPSCAMTLRLAEAAGVDPMEAVKAVAEKEVEVRPLHTSSFLRPAMASVLAGIVAVNLFLTPTPSEAAPALKEANGAICIM
jgi:transcriptional regulator with XRE-family HTH domain